MHESTIPATKNRITELDVLRGICILFMIGLHIPLMLQTAGGLHISWNPFAYFLLHEGGVFFVCISGICATLGSRSVRRGILVFCCGMILTAITSLLCYSGIESADILMQWGSLHMIGLCMLLYPLLKRSPTPLLIIAGIAVIIAGYRFRELRVPSHWLVIFGLRYMGYTCMDYFPVFPHLGWFMEGIALGRILYKDKTSLMPWLSEDNVIVRFLSACGRSSLQIFMLHFPILYLAAKLYAAKG